MNIAIYVICKASYERGLLYATWIAANQAASEIYEQIQAFLRRGPAPYSKSWWIEGYRGFYEIKIPREAALEKVAALGAFIDKHAELGAKLLIKMEGDLEKAQHFISRCFMGKYQSVEACIQAIFVEINTDVENPAFPLKVAREIFKRGCFVIEAGDFLYVFSQYGDPRDSNTAF
jgi:antirestriction protein